MEKSKKTDEPNTLKKLWDEYWERIATYSLLFLICAIASLGIYNYLDKKGIDVASPVASVTESVVTAVQNIPFEAKPVVLDTPLQMGNADCLILSSEVDIRKEIAAEDRGCVIQQVTLMGDSEDLMLHRLFPGAHWLELEWYED